MQTTGETCAACHQRINHENEGTWCARCRAVYHANCVGKGVTCLSCLQPWESPVDNVVRAEYCPACLARNDPPEANCAQCGESTQWDSTADYTHFREHLLQEARGLVVRGSIELSGGVASLVFFAVIFLVVSAYTSVNRFVWGLPLLFLALVSHGVYSIWRGRTLRRFK